MTTTTTAHLGTEADYHLAVQTARAAAAAYYGPGDSPLDDPAYDALLASIGVWESEHADSIDPDSPIGKVGGGSAPTGDVVHTVPMLSLAKAHTGADLARWAASLAKHLGGRAPRSGYDAEAKLDGCALAGRYRKGQLVQLVIRGDHASGEDVSFQIGHIDGLPTQLARPLTVEVRGEVVVTAEQFEQAQRLRSEHRDKPFSTRRSAATGSLRARNRSYRVPLTFVGYSAVPLDGEPTGLDSDTHLGMVEELRQVGVATLADSPVPPQRCTSMAEVEERIAEIAALRGTLPFMIDGVVVKADSLADQQDAGAASDHPYWAVAYKLPPTVRQTRLLEVTWKTGRTGIVAPRARVEPVELDGTQVEFASLHNPGFITTADLRVGDVVTICKAGDVVPYIDGPVVDLRDGSQTPIELPKACPKCGGNLDVSGKRWICAANSGCNLLPALLYAVGRKGFDIDGMGETYLEALIDAGHLSDIADLFTLTREQLASASGSDKRAQSLLAGITAAKQLPLHRVLCALGIPFTGERVSLRMAQHFGTMAAIQAATAQDVAAVQKMAAANAPKITTGLARMQAVVAKLAAAGVNLTEPETAPRPAGGPLAGMTVVVTGTMNGPLAGRDRSRMNQLIASAGGEASGSVSKRTSLLVAGDGAGSKLAKARQLGVTVATEAEFAQTVAAFL